MPARAAAGSVTVDEEGDCLDRADDVLGVTLDGVPLGRTSEESVPGGRGKRCIQLLRSAAKGRTGMAGPVNLKHEARIGQNNQETRYKQAPITKTQKSAGSACVAIHCLQKSGKFGRSSRR